MKFLFVVGFFISSLFSVDFESLEVEKCKIDIAKGISLDCRTGNDFRLEMSCNCKIDNFSIQMFTKFGDLIYETDEFDDNEDLRFLTEGTYFIISKGIYENGEKFLINGFIEAYTPDQVSE